MPPTGSSRRLVERYKDTQANDRAARLEGAAREKAQQQREIQAEASGALQRPITLPSTEPSTSRSDAAEVPHEVPLSTDRSGSADVHSRATAAHILQDLQTEKDQREQCESELESARARINDLETQLQAAEGRLDDAITRLRRDEEVTQRQVINSLRTELATAREECGRLRREIDLKEDRIHGLEMEISRAHRLNQETQIDNVAETSLEEHPTRIGTTRSRASTMQSGRTAGTRQPRLERVKGGKYLPFLAS